MSDANKRTSDLVTLSGRLIDLLERENQALRSHDNEAVATMLAEKRALCRAFESRVSGMDRELDALALVDAGERERLAELGRRVAALMEENGRLLKIGMEANRRVFEVAAEAVREARPPAPVYSARGRMRDTKPGAAPNSIPVSINESL